jgi:hypothetical protein
VVGWYPDGRLVRAMPLEKAPEGNVPEWLQDLAFGTYLGALAEGQPHSLKETVMCYADKPLTDATAVVNFFRGKGREHREVYLKQEQVAAESAAPRSEAMMMKASD